MSISDKRCLELQIECSPVVSLLETNWEIISHFTSLSNNNNVSLKWNIEICEMLKYISVLPIRNSANLSYSATLLILPYFDMTPNSLLEYTQEFCEVREFYVCVFKCFSTHHTPPPLSRTLSFSHSVFISLTLSLTLALSHTHAIFLSLTLSFYLSTSSSLSLSSDVGFQRRG